jgi:hypothetical protein
MKSVQRFIDNEYMSLKISKFRTGNDKEELRRLGF